MGGFKGLYMIKKEIENTKAEAGGGLCMAVVFAVLIFGFLGSQGCVPLITGLKQYKGSDGSEMNFITGADITFGANGLDSVDNNRGIAPEKYKK
jgi:hypothetical protein